MGFQAQVLAVNLDLVLGVGDWLHADLMDAQVDLQYAVKMGFNKSGARINEELLLVTTPIYYPQERLC
jgi:hypothetical protein